MAYNAAPLQVKTGVYLIDPCSVDHVPVDPGQLPKQIQPEDGGLVELHSGVARLQIFNNQGKLVGMLTMTGNSSVTFYKVGKLFPVGVTLNLGTIDCESDPNECELTVTGGNCIVVTTGTHFQVERTSGTDCVTVFSGSVKVTPKNSPTVLLRADEVGRVAKPNGLPNPVYLSSLSRPEKQAHNGGPAHY